MKNLLKKIAFMLLTLGIAHPIYAQKQAIGTVSRRMATDSTITEQNTSIKNSNVTKQEGTARDLKLYVIKSNTGAAGFRVNAAYPNSFTRETRISYNLPKDGVVNITISDVNGRVVKILKSSATERAVVWDGSGAAGAGVYFCTLEYAGIKKTVKLLKTE